MSELFDSYSKYPRSRLIGIGLDGETAAFMSQVGLPNWCAPNMHFGDEESWLPVISHQGEDLYVIGSDRDECPICINSEFSVIRYKEEQQDFLATNVQNLALALNEFQACINNAVNSDSEAYSKNNIPNMCMEPFVAWLMQNEPNALDGHAFWLGVLRWLKYKI